MSSPLLPRFFSDAGSHRHHPRKSVPEGSDDFQRVLDDILVPRDSDDKGKDSAQVDVTNDIYHEFNDFDEIGGDDDYDYSDEQESETDDNNEDSEGRASIDLFGTSRVDSLDSNNNCLNHQYKCSCDSEFDHDARAYFELGGALSPSEIHVVHCSGHCVRQAEERRGRASSSALLKLPQINLSSTSEVQIGSRNPGASSIMGTSCSSNRFDSRDWHDVAGNGGAEGVRKHRERQGRRARKLQELQSRERSREAASSPRCTCRGNGSGDAESDGKTKDGEAGGRGEGGGGQNQCVHKAPSHAKAHETPSTRESTASLSPSDAWRQQGADGTFLTPGKLSPEINSAGHVKVVRVPGPGKARATIALDVSPHRLLSRRAISTSTDKNGASDSVHVKTEPMDQRPRSQSWSNGKLGSAKSPPSKPLTSFLGSPILASLNSSKCELPQIRQGGTTSLKTGKSTSSNTSAKTITAKFHESTCPLYGKAKNSTKKQLHGNNEVVSKTTDSLNHVVEVDDFSPITRRRAASESHTTRPKRTLPRTPGISGSSEFHEHAHVHWADEEKGSSLSTSVFLTSIRPRSSSHSGTPHRPILKKVAGL